MSIRVLPLCLALIALFALSAQADEIKLKNGEVIKECKVRSKRGSKWTIELLDGSRRRIDADDIESHVEKPTIADKILEKFAKLDQKKDVEGMLELAREASDAGAVKATKTICRKITRADKENVEARELMGEKLCDDGKWRGGRSLEKYEQRKREKELKAKGYKKIKGEWVDPETAANLAAGLVKIEDEWYTKSDAANLEKGMIWCEGVWYEASDKEKLDSGMRKYKGKWLKIEEINKKIKEAGEAWLLQSKHFAIAGQQSHSTLTKFLDHAEAMWGPMVAFFGDAPTTAKAGDKIRIVVAKDQVAYGPVAEANGGDDRVAFQSSNIPGYFSPTTGNVVTYYYNPDYTTIWIQNGVACAFMSRVFGYDKIPSPIYESLAAYFMGFHKGKYACYDLMMTNGITSWTSNHDPAEAILGLDLSTPASDASHREARLNRPGFVVHYLAETHPDTIDKWMEFLRSGAKIGQFKKTLEEVFKDEESKKHFGNFVAQFRATWKRPM